MIRIFRKLFNKILKKEVIPQPWLRGIIKRIYKGKGTRGKCLTERGITLTSKFGKLFERIIDNRVKEHVTITNGQAGGRKGRATVDHLLILKEVIKVSKAGNKPVYVTFLDVQKAYDKAWLDAILYVLNKHGLENRLWLIVKNLNENLSATIKTCHGPTREIKITDSIRQGGVLSVVEYSLLMDEINKEILKKNIGIKLPNTKEKIGCLLWVDDVVLLSNNRYDMQQLLSITNNISQRYHIQFGPDKSQTMIINEKPNKESTLPLKLGNMDLKKNR